MQKGRKAKLRVPGRKLVMQALKGYETAEEKAWQVCKVALAKAQKAKVTAISRAREKFTADVQMAQEAYHLAVSDASRLVPASEPVPA